MSRTFATPVPIDMWEAGATALAAGLSHGEPLYARMNEPDSVEPGLYSPLQPLLLSTAFRWIPPNLTLFRSINLLAGAAFITLLLKAFGAFRSPVFLLCSLAILLAVDRQLTGLWELPRLDAVLLLFALIYVLLGYSAVEQQSTKGWLFATVVLAVGLLWKQTMLAVAFVPLIASFLVARRTTTAFRWLLFLMPLVVVVGVAIAAKLFSPNMFAALSAAGKFAIHPRMLARFALAVALSTPLIWLSGTWLLATAEPIPGGDKFAWALATCLGTLPLNFAAAAKVGGGPNSMAFLLYGAYAIVLLCLPEFLRYMSSEVTPVVKRYGLGAALAGGLVVTTVTILDPPSSVKLNRSFGDAGRVEILRIVKELPGKVVCPQDPTIPLFARGYAGVSVANEWDRNTWRWPLPKVLREMHNANYVITWGTPGTWHLWGFEEGWDELKRWGYIKMPLPELTGSDYSVWRKPGGLNSSSQTQ